MTQVCAVFGILTALLFVGYLFDPAIEHKEIGSILFSIGIASYAVAFWIARRGSYEIAGLIAASTISTLLVVGTIEVGRLHFYLFCAIAPHLVLSLVGRKSFIIASVLFHLVALWALAWTMPFPRAPIETLQFVATLTTTHGAVAWFASAYVTIHDETFSEAARARREAERASRAKSLFLANMSHELRTPLNAIIGYAELVREELAEEPDLSASSELHRDLERVGASGRHLLALIDGVLDLARLESGKARPAPARVELDALLDELRGAAAPLAERGRNEVVARLEPSAPRALVTDPTKTRQIALNLISNAAKFTEDGRITIAIGGAPGGGARIEVCDTGIGIELEALARIFENFEQADALVSGTYGGTGLGLALSRQLARLLGGELGVESEPGAGSRFWVTLPQLELYERAPAR